MQDLPIQVVATDICKYAFSTIGNNSNKSYLQLIKFIPVQMYSII